MSLNRVLASLLLCLCFAPLSASAKSRPPVVLNAFVPRFLGPQPVFVFSDYARYLVQSGAAVASVPAVFFADGSSLVCQDSRDTVLFYPETAYTRWYVENYAESVENSQHFFYPYEQRGSLQELHPVSGYPDVGIVRSVSCGSQPLGFLVRRVPVGDYLVLAFVHRYGVTKTMASTRMSNSEASYDLLGLVAQPSKASETYVLFNEVHMRSGPLATYHLNGFGVVASFL